MNLLYPFRINPWLKFFGCWIVVFGMSSCCSTTAAGCGEGVHFTLTGPDLATLDTTACKLSWQATETNGEIVDFYYSSDTKNVSCNQQGFPDNGIDESMEQLNVEFSCDGVILFSDTVPIVWEWKDDCNQTSGSCGDSRYLVGTVEIALP